MKILILHCSYKYRGGEDTVVEEEMRLLTSAGHEVQLLLFSNTRHILLKLLQLPFNLSSYVRTKKIIKSFRPDIVHIHNLHFAATASVIYAISRCKVPFVHTLHNYRLLCPSGTLFFGNNIFLDSLHQTFPWTAIKKGVYRNSKALTFWLSFSMKLHQWLGTWRLCNKYIVLTDFAQNLLLQADLNLNKQQVVIKPNFCSAPQLNNSARGRYFLYVGRLTTEKGLDLLMNVFSKSGQEIKIAGDGPLKNKIISFSKRFSNIKFLGSLDKQAVFKELTSCSALIFPSTWFEGMPLIIIEAFATGTPVIASKLGAMNSMIVDGYNGFHFTAASSEDLSNKVNKWVGQNEEQKLAIRKNALESYKRLYSPETNVRQLVAIYNSAIGEKANP